MLNTDSIISFLAFMLGNKADLISIEQLNSIKLEDNSNKNLNHLKKRILSIIEKEIESYKIKDGENIGLLLSGGLDSLLLLHLLKNNFPSSNIYTYTLGYNKEDKHLAISKNMSKRYNTNHREVLYNINKKLIETFDEVYKSGYDLEGEDSLIMNHILSREVKKDCSIVFSGFGLDYVFAGMDLFKNSFNEKLYNKGIINKKFILNSVNGNKYYFKYILDKIDNYDEDFFLKYGEYYGDILNKDLEKQAYVFFDKTFSKIRKDISFLKKQLYYIIHTSLSNRYNPYNKPYLKNNIKHYNPFGSLEFIKEIIKLNINDKFLYNPSLGEKKYIIREIARDLLGKDILKNLHSGTVLQYNIAIEQNRREIIKLVKDNMKLLSTFLNKEFLNNIDIIIKDAIWYENSKKIIILLQFLSFVKHNFELIKNINVSAKKTKKIVINNFCNV